MTISHPSFSLAVGGVGFQVHLPNDAWLAALAPLYSEFPLDCEPEWQVTVSHDPDLMSALPSWVEHDGPLTRFHIASFAGWVDLERHQALVRTTTLEKGASAVERGVGYACMHTLLRRRQSLMLHAAGILWQEQGLVVSGHSGAGKTTMARLALGYGEPFNDEVVIVDLAGYRPLLLSTPFLAPGTPPELRQRVRRIVPATALLLLAHAPDFQLTPMEPAEAVMELLRTNITAVERFSSAEIWLDMVQRLIQSMPVYRLRFRPTVELWGFLADALKNASAVELCAS
ncbi:MAG TPA: hypothetical protein VL334_16515 [Anaerolineae bacterium]|nr:hypothetical protein [Anaerolineae bacterium]